MINNNRRAGRQPAPVPWSGVTTILDFLRSQLALGADLEVVSLPDEEELDDPLRFVPGAWDGIVGHHLGGGTPRGQVAALFDAIRDACRDPASDERYAHAYELGKDPGLLDSLDPLLDRVRRGVIDGEIDGQPLPTLALRFTTTSAHRGPVKLGIALLGLFPVEPHRDVLLTLGRHGEFTLYAAVALGNGQADGTDDLWQLARHVHGWGRIHLVERLAASRREDVLDWIVRDGFRNAIMYEYLAYLAATRGNLLSRLTATDVDEELLDAAGDLLIALCNGGPAEDITDYADGAGAAMAFLNLIKDRPGDLQWLFAVGAIRDFVNRSEPTDGWPAGWTEPVRAEIRGRCAEIIAQPRWAELARAGLDSTDAWVFGQANEAHRILGISTLSTLLTRLRREPLDQSGWFSAMRQIDATTIDEVIAAAVEGLPLNEIASGPADEFGLGPGHEAHRCLGIVVQDLGDWPGRGWPLIAAALASPVVSNRNMALTALAAWPREAWPAEAPAGLRAALAAEPLDTVRKRITALLDN